jgi:hypothetical protein
MAHADRRRFALEAWSLPVSPTLNARREGYAAGFVDGTARKLPAEGTHL